jgi:preprotein translocase subunit SecY
VFRSQSGGILATADIFSGGAIHGLSIFALGINPFISAAILIQPTSMGVSTLARLRMEGERGRRLIHWYTLCLILRWCWSFFNRTASAFQWRE